MRRSLRTAAFGILWVGCLAGGAGDALASGRGEAPVLDTCSPESELVEMSDSGLDLAFCAEWSPDFAARGGRCCGNRPNRWRDVSLGRCDNRRRKSNYCDELTPEQRDALQNTPSEAEQAADQLLEELRSKGAATYTQAACTPNTGFLAFGRPIVPTSKNRVRLKNPERCTQFGTDSMVGLLEWLGREVADAYPESQTELLIGDVSAPRGGCLRGRGRGHASHTSGVDVDIGFLSPPHKKRLQASNRFSTEFDPEANWWLLRKMFQNPYACVQAVFLDWRMILKLKKVAGADADWERVAPYVKHQRNHRNHFHVRVGEGPGEPGCVPSEGPRLVDQKVAPEPGG